MIPGPRGRGEGREAEGKELAVEAAGRVYTRREKRGERREVVDKGLRYKLFPIQK